MDLDKLDNTDTSALDNAPDLPDLVYEDPDKKNTEQKEVEPKENINKEIDDIEETNEDNEPESNEIDEVLDTEEDNNSENDNDIEVNNTTTEAEPESKILIDFGDGKVEVDNIDELKTIASKALKDKNRYDKYKDELAILEGIKEQGLSDKDLYLLVEARKGNKQAIAKLLKETNIDPYDLDLEDESIDEYKPKEYKVDPKIMEVKSIIDDAKKDDHVFKTFDYILNKEFSEKDRVTAFEDPELLGFIKDTVKDGIFDKIAPNYTKRKIMGENAISAYINAFKDYTAEVEKLTTKTVNKVQEENKTKVEKRKKASIGNKKNVTKTDKKSINDMTDEEFEEYYKSIVGDF